MTPPAIRFDAALAAALGALKSALPQLAPNNEQVLLVRDLLGCFRIFLDSEVVGVQTDRDETVTRFERQFAQRLGRFAGAPEGLIQYWDASFPREDFFDSPDVWRPFDTPDNLKVIDRLVTGREWLLAPIRRSQPDIPRAVFFGIKGGVGRSTALALLAWHLSKQGKNVLVVDLDLESPGLGPILLPVRSGPENDQGIPGWPEFGVTDWFVEDAAGQADEALLRDMMAHSPLETNGWIQVVPACSGLLEQDYLSKLARAYLDLPHQDGSYELFGDRLARLLDQLENYCQPDVVLLDCRAGLHDISASALTRLNATNYLFAADTPQTWEAYRQLFKHWQRSPDHLTHLRTTLRTIASMVPNGVPTAAYRRGFCERALDVFSSIYDQEPQGMDGETVAFNFGPDDPDAPHYPVLIRFHPDYALFSPQQRSVQLDEALVQAAFGEFLAFAHSDLFPESSP